MHLMNFLFLLIFTILSILVILLNLILKMTFYDREKEALLNVVLTQKLLLYLFPSTFTFFLIAIIFLIFDVEITFLLPLILTLKVSKLMSYSYIVIFFIAILIGGLYHEWNQGALNWTN